jgi:hypothetical protein
MWGKMLLSLSRIEQFIQAAAICHALAPRKSTGGHSGRTHCIHARSTSIVVFCEVCEYDNEGNEVVY